MLSAVVRCWTAGGVAVGVTVGVEVAPVVVPPVAGGVGGGGGLGLFWGALSWPLACVSVSCPGWMVMDWLPSVMVAGASQTSKRTRPSGRTVVRKMVPRTTAVAFWVWTVNEPPVSS